MSHPTLALSGGLPASPFIRLALVLLVFSGPAGICAQTAAATSAPPAAAAPAGSTTAAPAPAPAAARGPIGPATPAELLATVTAPAEFDITVFATPDQANYPVSVAAAPDGTLYVASDANSSLGVDLGRGRIVRLRDTDGDGRADEVKQFAKMDSPRGLVWDGDRLYVMHPPHFSAYFDRDGDGISESHQVLVKNIAFSFRDRPADHSSNGVTLGIDGWLYLAIGDFGFMEAEGTDGRKLQLRGGGVVRVRRDGTGLELYSRGTRNILEVALSPLLEGIARDNTNDGDGWDVRLHHFTGLEDHGYPTLFKNFKTDMVAALADFGSGAGCGALWLDEPGIPAKWNKRPLTVDWGRETIYAHELTAKGATFGATQEQFAKLPRATDLDVDAQSRLYVGSWRGGQYTFGGNNVGYIARLTPKNYQPTPLPDFAKINSVGLIKLHTSPSHRTRLEAQRVLLSRGLGAAESSALQQLARTTTLPVEARIAALFTLKQGFGEKAHDFLVSLAADPTIAAWAVRALTDHDGQVARVPDAPLLAALRSTDPRTRREATIALARLGRAQHATALTSVLGDADPVIAHTAVQAMVQLRGADAALSVVDNTDVTDAKRAGALQVLQALHEVKVVDALIARLTRETDPGRRDGLVRALTRLYYLEGKWTGDSWGTRPDTRGPYYQPERWAGSAAIATVLKGLLDRADGAEIGKLNEVFAVHRVSPGDSTGRLLALAEKDDTLLPSMAQQLASADEVPAAAVPLLQKALTWMPPPPPPPPAPPAPKEGEPVATAQKGARGGRGARGGGPPPAPPAQLAAVQALVKVGTPEAIAIVLNTLPTLQNRGRLGDGVRDKAANALFQANTLPNHARFFSTEAAKLSGETAVWADAALLHLGAKKLGAPEASALANQQLDDGWKTPARRAQIIRAAALARETTRATAMVAALDDADPAVAEAAKASIATLKIDADAIRADSAQAAPLIATLKSDDVLAQVFSARGTVARGEQLFTQAACVACHTVNPGDPLKGPFLGNIARLYGRRELAESILEPNKTIAQGFATNQFTLKNGTSMAGFVARESADVVSIRDITGQQHEIRVADIAKRDHVGMSLMPPGLMAGYTVRDFASLLDYLQSLAPAGN